MSTTKIRSSRVWAPLALALLLSLPLSAQEAKRKMGEFTITHEVPVLGVESQGRTGTCWSFATVSFFESEAARKAGKPVDLSEMWPVRQVWLEKTREYIARRGKNTFGQGGLSHDLSLVIERYGLLPASAYPGMRPGARRHDHSELERVLKAAASAYAKSRRPSKSWEEAILGITDAYLGEPPAKVKHEGRELTPLEYTKEVLGIESGQYVEVMSLGKTPFGKPAKLEVPDNWMHYDRYRNVDIDTFMKGMIHALENGYSIALDCDVSEPGFDARRGIATLPAELEKPGAITQEVRDRMFDKKETTDDHLMHVTGLARDAEGRLWFLTKNSWGKVGKYEGFLFLSENYVRAKALAFMVNRNGLPVSR